MARGPKGKRYAQALFAIAVEQGREEAWLDQLRRAEEAVLSDETAEAYLTMPRVRLEQKLEAVRGLLPGMDKPIVSMIGLLVSRRSLDLLPQIVDEYAALLNWRLGRVQVDVTTAVPVTDQQQTRLRESLSSALGGELVLQTREDPSIIGGMVVRVGDQVLDGSLRTRLESLRERLRHEALV